MTEFHFDVRNGDLLIGVGAAALRMEEAGPDVVPLIDVLRTPNFDYDFPKLDVESWQQDDYINYGHWVLNLVTSDTERTVRREQTISTPVIQRLYHLGLGPRIGRIEARFRTLARYKNEVGAPLQYDNVSYTGWGTANYVAYAKELQTVLGRLPIDSDYQAAFDRNQGPNPKRIYLDVGGISELHELLGYPNIRQWQEENFIDWGVKVMLANPGMDISARVPDVLARHKHGPTARTIANRFKSWSRYKAIITTAYEQLQAEQNAKLANYTQMIDDGELPEEYRLLAPDVVLNYGGRYIVARRCLPKYTPDQLWKIVQPPHNSFLYMLRTTSKLSAGHIETEAVMSGVFDDIWPPTEYLEQLHVSEEELAAERSRRAKTEWHRWAAKHKGHPAVATVLAHESAHDPAQNNAPPHATPYV